MSDDLLNAALEGDDAPPERIRVFMYGDNFVSVDGGDLTMSASGPGCLATVARKLLAVGYDPDSELDVRRGGELRRLLLRDAAGGDS
jgi:hypothetical protein